MTGREVVRDPPPQRSTPSRRTASSRSRASLKGGVFDDVSFTSARARSSASPDCSARAAPRSPRSLFGIHPADSGTVRVEGRPVRIDSIHDAIDAGIGYVPADRLTEGLFLEKCIAENIIAASLDRHRTRGVFTDRRKVAETIDRFFTALRIKAPDVDCSRAEPVRRQRAARGARQVARRRPQDPDAQRPDRGRGRRLQGGDPRDPPDRGCRVAWRSSSSPTTSPSWSPSATGCSSSRRGGIVDELAGDQVDVTAIEKGLAA